MIIRSRVSSVIDADDFFFDPTTLLTSFHRKSLYVLVPGGVVVGVLSSARQFIIKSSNSRSLIVSVSLWICVTNEGILNILCALYL